MSIQDRLVPLVQRSGMMIKQQRLEFDQSKVERKGLHDFVSYVDRQNEEYLVKYLHSILPEAGFVTEEGTAKYNGERYWWVIDPLDGTTNYIHNQWPYCVSVALRDANEVLIGVVFDPIRYETFVARRDSYAMLNGKKIQVSKVRLLKNAFIALGFPYNSDAYRSVATSLVRHYYGHCAGVRLQGSAALELCQVAAGRVEARIEAYLGEWDIAAASLILKKAGGTMTTFDGNPDCLDAHSVLASNGAIHNRILKTTSKYKL